MIHRPLDDALETNGLLKHIFVAIGDLFNFFPKKIFQGGDQIFNISTAVFDDVNPVGIV
jgi:hypothetical protein